MFVIVCECMCHLVRVCGRIYVLVNDCVFFCACVCICHKRRVTKKHARITQKLHKDSQKATYNKRHKEKQAHTNAYIFANTNAHAYTNNYADNDIK